MEGRKGNQATNKLDQARATLKRRAYGKASYVAGDETFILVGGKVIIKGQPRFIPVRVKRQSIRHCKSCGSFRACGSCTTDADTFTVADAQACGKYWNRTHDQEARQALACLAQ